MEERKQPLRVECMSTDTTMPLAESVDRKTTDIHEKRKRNCLTPSQAVILMSLVAICLIIAGPTLTFWLLRRGEKASNGEKTRYAELPDAVKFQVEAVGADCFTLTWERPEGNFDYYWISAVGSGDARSRFGEHHFGPCTNDSQLEVNQTRITCDHIPPCTSISVTLRTLTRGPPTLTSKGITIHGLFIPGKAPEPPRNLTITEISPSAVRVQWSGSHVTPDGILITYSVVACELEVVGHPARFCHTHKTADTSLKLVITRGASYWIEVTARAVCGGEVLRSAPVGGEFASAPYEVANLRLESFGEGSFSASWDRPKGQFDYYIVRATDGGQASNASGPHELGFCGEVIILSPNQTRVTCTKIEPCTNVTFLVRTHNNGPPARTSRGVTLRSIFIPGGAPDDFNVSVKVVNQSTVQVTLGLTDIKPCLKARCQAVLINGSHRTPVQCQEYVGKEKTLIVRNVKRQQTYIFAVTMTSAINGKNATKSAVFRIA